MNHSTKINWRELLGRVTGRRPTPPAKPVIYQQPVNSSHLERVAYRPDTQVLQIMFLNGAIYHFRNVPEGHYKGLIEASSKGKYFWKYIRNVYPYDRVRY